VSYSDKIDILWDFKKLDANLGHKLLNYAYTLALVLIDAFWGYPYFGMKKSTIENELEYIKKIKKEIMECIGNYSYKYPIFERYEEMKSAKEKDNYIIHKFGLERFFWTLNARARWIKQYLDFPPPNIRGRPINKIHKIALLWAFEMKSHDEIPWANIIRLLKWFYERLKNTSYGSEISISDDAIKPGKKFTALKKKIKKQCSPIICNEDYWDSISRKGIFIPEYRPNVIRINPHSIKFNKESIEIAEEFKEDLISHIVKFKEGKKYYSMNVSRLPPREKLPFISFPSRENLLS